MSLSTDQPVKYPSIQHLASITEEDNTEGIFLNPQPAKELPLTRDDREELNFPDERTFLCHVETTPREVYNLVMRLQKYLMLVDKQNCKLKAKFTNYKKANEGYVINNIQLKTKNQDLETQLVNLENQLANLKKQLEDARSNKYFSPSPLPPSTSFLLPASAFDSLDGKSKHFHYSHHFCKTKSTKLPDSPMLTDGNAARFDINMWESKMAKKLTANVDHYNTEALHMTYVDSRIDGDAYKHLATQLRIGAKKPFSTAEKMFKVFQKAYDDVNWQHTAMNKFKDLKMTKDFNSFWVEF